MKAIYSFKLLTLAVFAFAGTAVQADPTRPAGALAVSQGGATTGAEQELKLQLIIKNNEGYRALLNGQLVKTGDKLATYQVLNITADNVVLRSEHGQKRLTINNNSIKTYEPE